MLPFINLFGRDIPMYGVMMLLGASLATLLAIYNAKKYGAATDDALYISLFAIIGGLVGSTLLYAIVTVPQLEDVNLLDLSFWSGILSGGVFYGGLIGGALAGYFYCRRYKLSAVEWADTLAPSLALGHAMGRLGCFFAGCCYGIPAQPPLGLVFANSPVAPHDESLLPVQLIEAAFNLLLCLFLSIFLRKRPRKGKVAAAYLLCYAPLRFALEFLRYDAHRGVFVLSTSQWISIFMLVFAIILLVRLRTPKEATKG